ncbi:MAG: alpha/beta fold hydrolase [Pirellulales bacterium]|nr:alpha/beta fold hydrolase [Pirellulales bacterium]
MKKTTSRLTWGSMVLCVALGLAGCCGSQSDMARGPESQSTDSNQSTDQGIQNGVGTSKPIIQESPTAANQSPAEPFTPLPDREMTATAPADRDARVERRPALGRRTSKAARSKTVDAAPPTEEKASAKAMSPNEAAIREILEGVASEGPSPGSAPKISVQPEATPMTTRSPLDMGPSSAAIPMESRGGGMPTEIAAPAMTPQMMTAARTPEPPPETPELRAMTAPAEPADAAATSSSPVPTAAAPDATMPTQDYKLVQVFYGTDRAAVAGVAAHPLGKIPWGTLTAAAGGLTLLLIVVLLFARRNTALRLGVGLSLLATLGLGACMIQIPRNTKPGKADTSLAYGNGRGELEMGVCEVSIPKDHRVGELESPSILRLEFNEDPEKHVVLMKVQRQEPDAFYGQLRERIGQDDRREAFVFIHGYNVTFENAARRTAQLAHDLEFAGAPIFYSWPSQGGLLQYTVDEENIVYTVPHLKEFLVGVAEKTNARRIHLIAHSMGNRGLTAALRQLADQRGPDQAKLFHEVLLTAPDIDAEIFRRDIAPAIVKTAQRVTLYASSRDTALAASRQVHGYPRAGESGENLVVIPGIDTIDVSAVDTSLVGHSYYGDSDTVLVDMAQLLHDEKPPDLRDRLRQQMLGALRYWVFLTERISMRPDGGSP